MNVPIFYFLWGLTYKESVVVSLSTLMGNYLCQVRTPFLSFYFSFYFSFFRLSYIFFLSPSHSASLDLNCPTNTHTLTHTHTYIHTYTHKHAHTHTHTHTRTHTQVLINLTQRHPELRSRSLIYWDAVLILLPAGSVNFTKFHLIIFFDVIHFTIFFNFYQ